MQKKRAVYFCDPSSIKRVYGPEERAAIAQRLDISDTLVTRENWREHRELLRDVEVIVSSWGGAILDEELLAAMPKLQIYFYGAGTIRGLMTPAAWDRGIRITSAVAANAVPVAEFVLAQILFSLKRGWEYMQLAKADSPQIWQCDKPVPGNYNTKVGIVSLGQIARKTCELLKPFDLQVFASSSYASPELAKRLGVTFTSMKEIFRICDVVSIHLPSNEKTAGMIDKKLLSLMKPKSTLINSARGAVINQVELIEFLKERPDVYACIDVTEPEPPESGCPLFELDNVVLTPHLAGSMGGETKRLAEYMIDEIDLWLAGDPLQWEVTREKAAAMA